MLDSFIAVGRVMLYSPTKEGCDFLVKKLPFKEELYDCYTDFNKAKEALKSNDYEMLFVDLTIFEPSARELIMWAHAYNKKLTSFFLTRSERPIVMSNVWNIGKDSLFHFEKMEVEVLTIPLCGMFNENSHLQWITAVSAAFHKMRRKLHGSIGETVLLVGPSGVGKLSLAQLSHFKSPRRGARFIFANCKSLEQPFHKMWTDRDKRNFKNNIDTLMEQAAGGTLYLHEIDHLDYEAQGILADKLRLVKRQKNRYVPGIIVCSTRVDIHNSVEDETFSPALADILTTNMMRVPALAEYDDDIIPLAEELLKSYCAVSCMEPKALTNEAKEIISKHKWSRNIRELHRALSHAASLAKGKLIKAQDISLDPIITKEDTSKDKARKLKSELRKRKGNIQECADFFDVSRKTIYAWMKDANIPKGYGRPPKEDSEAKG